MNNRRVSVIVLFLLAVLLSITISSAIAQDENPHDVPAADLAGDIDFKAMEAAMALAQPPFAKERLATGQAAVAQTASPPANLFEAEPNDSFATANPIGVGDVISAMIGSETDMDFFVIEETNGEYLLFDVDAGVNGSRLDSILVLYDADRKKITVSDDSDDYLDSLIYFKATNPPYYLKVREFSYPEAGGADYFYTLSVSNPLLVSANMNGSVEGMPFTKSDILAWQQFWDGSEKWSMFFDASDMGVKTDVEGIGHVTNPSDISISLRSNLFLPVWDDVLGDTTSQKVKAQDIIGYHGTYGANTSGIFYWVAQGKLYCLTTVGERIDAISDTSQFISTTGRTMVCSGEKMDDATMFSMPDGIVDFPCARTRGLCREDIIGAFYRGDSYFFVIQGRGKMDGNRVDHKQIFEIDYRTGAWVGHYWGAKNHGFPYPLDAIEQ